MRRIPRLIAAFALAIGLFVIGCDSPDNSTIEGRPGGPYRMTFAAMPIAPIAGQVTELTERLTHSANDEPVRDLQILHERVIHNFIVSLDFSHFAHIHHEDFDHIIASDLARASFHFPYTFPANGAYRIVSEFTHRDRSWTKHFDIQVGKPSNPTQVVINLGREKIMHGYQATLSVSPTIPVAGFETEMVLELMRNQQPVTDLALLLGSEIHVALWRIDGRHFGHTHAYTPHMAAMMAKMHDRSVDPAKRAKAMTQMMIDMMNEPAELVFTGPRIPMRYVFSEPGTYAIFLHCAPAGQPQVFNFMIEVVAYQDGMNTRINSPGEPAHQAQNL